MDGRDIHRLVCDFFDEHGFPTSLHKEEGAVLEDGFYHGTGHGVGLAVHEAPFMGRIGHELVAGDVITIEPGLYRRGFGGVRLEDLLLVTEDGCEVLTDFPYDLEVASEPARRRGPRGRIETLLAEERRYPPPEDFAAQANAQPEIYDVPFEEFWEREGRERVTWFEPFTSLLEWELPYAKWYLGGKINVAYNCLDRHVEAGRGDKVAFYFEGEPEGERAAITYAQLLDEVVRVANGLKERGVKKGTPVGIYMGMGPGLPIAMLACARLGAPHTVVFGGFSAESLADRLNDMECELLITQDEGWRRGQTVPLKGNADEALESCPKVKTVVVGQRTRADVPMQDGRDITWSELVEGQSEDPASCPCEPMDSEDLLYLLYTSGTTAKPKGIAHTTAGYLVGVAATHHYIFDLKPDSDVYWCAADIGWVTGHSYIVYGPLCNGATSVLYEGTPDFPDKDRWWDIVERYGVTILYTAPTAIRAHMKWGPEHAERHDLSSLRLLGTVGEPINPEAWIWYREHIGADRLPVVDTWWQTETGMVLITPLPGVTTTKPGSATKPFPGVEAAVVNDRGEEVGPGRWRVSRPEEAVAGDAARDLQGPRPLRRRRTGRGSRGCTSRATAPGSTRTATSGSWAGWTT